MATVAPTTSTSVTLGQVVVTWAGMVTGDTITAHAITQPPHRATVQATGTFNGGTVIGMTGSVDGTNFAVLDDAGGSAISGKTAAFLEGIRDSVREYKPTIGSGSADSVTVTLTYWNSNGRS
jgi:hypothetical protein